MPEYAVSFSYPANPALDDAVGAAVRDIAEYELKFGSTTAGGRRGDVWVITADDAEGVKRIVAEVRERVPEILDVSWQESRGMA